MEQDGIGKMNKIQQIRYIRQLRASNEVNAEARKGYREWLRKRERAAGLYREDEDDSGNKIKDRD